MQWFCSGPRASLPTSKKQFGKFHEAILYSLAVVSDMHISPMVRRFTFELRPSKASGRIDDFIEAHKYYHTHFLI